MDLGKVITSTAGIVGPAAAAGPPGLVLLGVSVGLQIIGLLLKPRKKTPPQEILPWEEITAELGTTVPLVFGTTFVEQTMVLGKYNFNVITVPAPTDSNKK